MRAPGLTVGSFLRPFDALNSSLGALRCGVKPRCLSPTKQLVFIRSRSPSSARPRMPRCSCYPIPGSVPCFVLLHVLNERVVGRHVDLRDYVEPGSVVVLCRIRFTWLYSPISSPVPSECATYRRTAASF